MVLLQPEEIIDRDEHAPDPDRADLTHWFYRMPSAGVKYYVYRYPTPPEERVESQFEADNVTAVC